MSKGLAAGLGAVVVVLAVYFGLLWDPARTIEKEVKVTKESVASLHNAKPGKAFRESHVSTEGRIVKLPYPVDGITHGWKIAQVNPNSPLAKWGFQAGDTVVRVHNFKLSGLANPTKVIEATKKLPKVEIVLMRGNDKVVIETVKDYRP